MVVVDGQVLTQENMTKMVLVIQTPQLQQVHAQENLELLHHQEPLVTQAIKQKRSYKNVQII